MLFLPLITGKIQARLLLLELDVSQCHVIV